MQKIKVKALLVVLFVAIVGITFIYLHKNNISDKENGLNNFYQATKEDPLVASPELDHESLIDYLEVMKKRHDKILKDLDLKKNYIPFDFFNGIVNVNKAQAKFLKNPDRKKAEELISSYKKAHIIYKKELNDLKNELDAVFEYQYIFLSPTAYVDRKIILKSFDVMLENAEALGKEIEFRERILNGEKYKERTFSSISPNDIRESDLPTDILGKDKLVWVPKKLDSIKGPYSVSSFCLEENDQESEYFYIYKSPHEQPYAPFYNFEAKLATNNYYRRVSRDAAQMKTTNLSKKYPAVEHFFIPRNDGEFCACRSADHLPTLLTIDHLLNHKNKKLFDDVLESPYYKDLSARDKKIFLDGNEAEDMFFSQQVPSEDNMNILGEYYFRGYRALRNNDLTYESNEHKEDLLERYLLIRNKMSGITAILVSAKNIGRNEIRMEHAELGKSVDWLVMNFYVTRSRYPLMFLNFSPTIWRINKTPVYAKKFDDSLFNGKSPPFFSYKELSAKLDDKTLKKIRQYGIEYTLWWQKEFESVTSNK